MPRKVDSSHPTVLNLDFTPSPGALQLIRKLEDNGFPTWIVGGCLRDFMLGYEPKDLDIVTAATPSEIRKIFRSRCRIIGRRFRLAHIYTQEGIIEVSTLRSAGFTSTSKDHAFGHSPAEDAGRRDFTVNALYFRPTEHKIYDFQGGLKDIREHHIRLIGDVNERIREDPMRMLRALRFAAKLNLCIGTELLNGIKRHRALIADLPPARLMDETLKLFCTGHAGKSYDKLIELEMLDFLFPRLHAAITEDGEKAGLVRKALKDADTRRNQGMPASPAYLFAALLWPLVVKEYRKNEAPPPFVRLQKSSREVLREQGSAMPITRQWSVEMIDIWLSQLRMARLTKRSVQFVHNHRRFGAFYDFLQLRSKTGENRDCKELADWWQQHRHHPAASSSSPKRFTCDL